MTKRKASAYPRHRNYEHNKLLEAPADNHDGRPSLELEDRLLDALKQHHFISKGKIRERPQEPPECAASTAPGLDPGDNPQEKPNDQRIEDADK